MLPACVCTHRHARARHTCMRVHPHADTDLCTSTAATRTHVHVNINARAVCRPHGASTRAHVLVTRVYVCLSSRVAGGGRSGQPPGGAVNKPRRLCKGHTVLFTVLGRCEALPVNFKLGQMETGEVSWAWQPGAARCPSHAHRVQGTLAPSWLSDCPRRAQPPHALTPLRGVSLTHPLHASQAPAHRGRLSTVPPAVSSGTVSGACHRKAGSSWLPLRQEGMEPCRREAWAAWAPGRR